MGVKTCAEAGFISRLFFWWLNDLLLLGYERELKSSDISNQLLKSDLSNEITTKTFNLWDSEIKTQNPSLFRVIRKQFGVDYCLLGFLPFVEECGIKVLQPILLGSLIEHLKTNTPPYLEAGLIILCSIFNVFTTHYFYFSVQHVGMRMRVACSCLIYRKCLRQLHSPAGRLLNLLSSDVQRFDQSSVSLHYLWIGPLNVLIVFTILYHYYGVASFFGLAFLLNFTVLQAFFGVMFSKLRSQTASCTDARMDFMNSMLKKMKQIKMLSLEDFYREHCAELRKKEVDVIRKAACLRAFNSTFFNSSIKILLFITIWWYNIIDTGSVFVMISFYQSLRNLMTNNFPNGVLQFAEAKIALNRIQTYLLEANEEPLCEKENVNDISIHISDVPLKLRKETLNLKIANGDIVSIVGSVGTGKTTILKAILGETKLERGDIRVHGRIAYVPQTPWIYPGSMQDNIILNSLFDPIWYEKVLQACALVDFGHISLGNLSGGMRSRISLARAAYSRADIYLFDDPFSALDGSTKSHIIQDLLTKLLDGKIRIICGGDGRLGRVVSLDQDDVGIDLRRRRQSMAVMDSSPRSEEVTKKVEVQEENCESGNVRWKTYFEYFRIGSPPFLLLVVLLVFLGSQVGWSGSDYYLRNWHNLERDIAIQNYGFFVIFILASSLLRSILFYFISLNSSVNLHDHIFTKVSKAHQEFLLDYGKILNRFGKDMSLIDESLPSTFLGATTVLLNVVGSIVVISIVEPLLLLPAVILTVIFYFLRRFYIRTGLAVKRIEGMGRTPLFTLISSTASGLSTIRCYKAEEKFLEEFTERLDNHSRSWYISLATSRWFGIWLDWLSVLYTAIVVSTFVIISRTGSDVGLVISSVLALSATFQVGARQSADVENQMVAVERVLEYSNIPGENFECGASNVQVSAPIEFIDVSVTYNDLMVLKNLNFRIKEGEKIALLGKTGCGKSTLLKALYRLADYSGTISFNGIDSKDIKLRLLRSSMSMIPQEPYIFRGTIRENLDPHAELLDDEICRVFNKFSYFFEGLYSTVEEDGRNLSQGQRQILSLIRVILKGNKILVLDEPTANLDLRTDELIRESLDEFCSTCTVITVAHRLWTISHYDRAFLIQDGALYEIPVPQMKDSESVPVEVEDIIA